MQSIIEWVKDYWEIVTVFLGLSSGAGGAIITNKKLNSIQDKRIENLEIAVEIMNKELSTLTGNAIVHYKLDKQNKVAFEEHKTDMKNRLNGLQNQLIDLPFKILELNIKVNRK